LSRETIQSFEHRHPARRQWPNRLENLRTRFFFVDHHGLTQVTIDNWQLRLNREHATDAGVGKRQFFAIFSRPRW
jgi:hypothetical protein